ncbi:MAG: hypothetical protein MUF48_02560 [Pirellulaceae bacterium]|jgi:hypothetical protein|nr:hypothetical protein [Pirellulaceae bacterium]
MAARDKTLWKEWAERLRQEMMTGLTPQVTKSVDAIGTEIGTEKSSTVLHSRRFWSACQSAQGANDVLVKAGFIVEFASNGESEVDMVTLRLNDTWQSIMQNVIDRRSARGYQA